MSGPPLPRDTGLPTGVWLTGQVIAALALLCALTSPAFALAAQRDEQFTAFGALFVFAGVVVVVAVIWYSKRRRRGSGWY